MSHDIEYQGELYTLSVLQVITKDEYDRPKSVKVIHDDDVVDLSDEEESREFITAFLRSENTDIPSKH